MINVKHAIGGLIIIMKWIKYQIFTTTKDADNIGGILNELGIYGYEITDHVPLTEKEEKLMYTDIPADIGEDDGSSILTFYTETNEHAEHEFFSTGSSIRDSDIEQITPPFLPPEELIEKIIIKIQKLNEFFKIQIPEITYSIEDDSEWKDKWKDNFKPFRVADDIIIKPSWEQPPADMKDGDLILEIDPGSAFGTGTHETTRLCLFALRKYITTDTTILDAGCGSGILALSALLCGAKSAFCLDIDANAVNATIENAMKNGFSEEQITALHANILEDTESIKNKLGAPVDIAVANILADVIILLADKIGEFIKDNGIFISSGILTEKADEVEAALLKNNFNILNKTTDGEWTCFVCKKV